MCTLCCAHHNSAVLLALLIGHIETRQPLLSTSTLCVPLQKDSSQTDLTAKLANMSMNNPDVTQQMYALYDGTQASLNNTPDIRMFTNQLPGQDCCHGVLSENRFSPKHT